MQEFKQYVLGDYSIPFYLAAGFFCGLTILVSLYLHSTKRDISSPNTPVKFSWSFLLWDNTKRIAVGLIVMFLFFRFSSDIFGGPLSMKMAVIVGVVLSFGVDKAIQFFQGKFPVLQMPRNIPQNEPTQP
jgi:hypothetical protein